MSEVKKWVVHKFGGTSVGSAESMRKCIGIISPIVSEKVSLVAVVVSAMGGKPKTTDLLLVSKTMYIITMKYYINLK